MTTIKRRIAAVSAPVLLALTLTACGGGPGSDAPEDASVDAFCEKYIEVAQLDDGAAIKDWAEGLAEVGTPEDISDDARKGFEVFVNEVSDIDDDATADDVADIKVSDDDKEAADSFAEYATTTCSEAMMENLPTDVPTE